MTRADNRTLRAMSNDELARLLTLSLHIDREVEKCAADYKELPQGLRAQIIETPDVSCLLIEALHRGKTGNDLLDAAGHAQREYQGNVPDSVRSKLYEMSLARPVSVRPQRSAGGAVPHPAG